MRRKVVLITGASSGVGRAAAEYLCRRNYQVYGAARSQSREDADGYRFIYMDVSEEQSVVSDVRRIMEAEGRIDVAVNCAGFALAGSIEDTSIEEAKAQFETNFFGALRVCKAVIPIMRRQNSGLIVNISSIGGLVSLPFQGLYCASKFALEGLTEALRMEVLPFGVKVALVEPGNFKTALTINRKQAAGALESAVYRRNFDSALSVIEDEELNAPDPLIIARLLGELIEDPSPKLRYRIGLFSERAVVQLRKVIPHKIFERLLMRHYRLEL